MMPDELDEWHYLWYAPKGILLKANYETYEHHQYNPKHGWGRILIPGLDPYVEITKESADEIIEAFKNKKEENNGAS